MPPDYNPFEDPSKTPDGDTGKPKEPDKAPDAVSPEQQVAVDAANKRASDAEARALESLGRYEQMLEEVTATLSGRYEQKVAAQEPVSEPVVTDADYDKRPAEVVETISRKAAKEESQAMAVELGQHYGKVIGNLTEQAFEGQMEGLRAERFHKYLEPDIRKFFEDNPQGKASPQAARTIYAQYVGQRIEELLEKESADGVRDAETQDSLTRQRIVRPDVRDEPGPRSPAPRGPRVTQAERPGLEGGEKDLCAIYTRYGIFEGEEDWANWKDTLAGNPRTDIPQDYTQAGRQ